MGGSGGEWGRVGESGGEWGSGGGVGKGVWRGGVGPPPLELGFRV